MLTQEIQDDIESLKSSVAMSCSAFENVPSLNDIIITAGERLASTFNQFMNTFEPLTLASYQIGTKGSHGDCCEKPR